MNFLAKPFVPAIKWEGTHRSMLIPGEMELLVHLVKSVHAGRMLEIGCRDGRTAKVMLANVDSLNHYVGVDVPFQTVTTLAHQKYEVTRHPGNLVIDDPRFELMIRPRGSFDLTPDELPRFNAIFIDGDHSAEAVINDSMLAKSVILPDGIIIWHDYNNTLHGPEDGEIGVKMVLDHLVDVEGWEISVFHQTWLAFLRT